AYYRSVLSLILLIVATFLISCGSPSAAKIPETYSSAQLEQIQQYIPDLVALRDRMDEIPTMIQRRDWIDVSNFVHGPLGELRLKMTYVTRNLLPKDQEPARQATRDFLNDLLKIEQAAADSNSQSAVRSYQAALADINKFLGVVPKPST
ncbi:photosystem II protein PsbQ, partial [Pediococcus acidilactici]|uniref:photosystem II protein PsbQ n=1 Tax=Pediococcus acidilactici TaxID=1254 RepID=UPI003188FFC9